MTHPYFTHSLELVGWSRGTNTCERELEIFARALERAKLFRDSLPLPAFHVAGSRKWEGGNGFRLSCVTCLVLCVGESKQLGTVDRFRVYYISKIRLQTSQRDVSVSFAPNCLQTSNEQAISPQSTHLCTWSWCLKWERCQHRSTSGKRAVSVACNDSSRRKLLHAIHGFGKTSRSGRYNQTHQVIGPTWAVLKERRKGRQFKGT